ncbi:hypothetical protein [Bacillus alkalicellulosilyticus]|uniref:hypothetical protein n=1 Tax=Alkalihalobacterium alkalicellulosilyticum TaxID=1912214 RepID=UPI001481FDA9|nr:hypothetical protein [Bacillus alkalicellulosilyticus]
MIEKERFRIVIRCTKCGEKYILRGRRKSGGGYETGFKRCVCGNEDQLKVDATPE